MEIKLNDNRTLAYAEYGGIPATSASSPRSGGTPLFFFHGTPGSRLFHPPDEITRKMGVRLICVDRPGYGGSTFQRGRRILDWPEDIAQLADHLGLGKFAVAGHSGGGPYTAACAQALPERVTAAAILSGAGPLDAPGATQGMTFINMLGFRFGRYIPWALGRLLVWWIYRQRCADPARAIERETGRRPLADEKLMSRPEVREACIRSEVEAFRPGLRGLAWDVRLITRPWGFRLEEIRAPTYLWHGTDDNLTTIAMAQYVASKIPNCKATICEGEAHLLLFSHWEEILRQLISH